MSQYVALRALNRSARVRVTAVLGQPTGASATAVGTGGTFAAATYYWKIVAIDAAGDHSLPSAEVSATIVLNGSATLAWTAVSGATSYQVWRGTASAGEDHYQTTTTNSFTDTGAAGTASTLPTLPTGTVNTALGTHTDTVVDLDVASTRQQLSHHSAIGQYIVSAANTSFGVTGAKTTLPANA